jgi:hypothetical protein
MTRAFTKEEAAFQEISMGEAQWIDAGAALLDELTREIGLGSTAVIHNAYCQIIMRLLHSESPMPEVTIDSIEKMLAHLQQILATHRECHLKYGRPEREEAGITGAPKKAGKPTVH